MLFHLLAEVLRGTVGLFALLDFLQHHEVLLVAGHPDGDVVIDS